MPALIDPERLPVDDLPAIWSPVQTPLDSAERARELEAQATASLLWACTPPEAVLRLLLGETDIARAFEPPARFDPALQGEWDASLVTFEFARPIRLLQEERGPDRLALEYKLEGAGVWRLELTPESVSIHKL
jgi:hypothetical protein